MVCAEGFVVRLLPRGALADFECVLMLRIDTLALCYPELAVAVVPDTEIIFENA